MNIIINTTAEIKTLKDLTILKTIVEVNKLNKPNFSQLARELGVDRRTVRKHYEGINNKKRKQKESKTDEYEEIIDKILFTQGDLRQIFYYKSHLYRFLVREYNLNCSRSNFNRFILQNDKYADYFNPKDKPNAIKSETPFGKQAQFDWKEKLDFHFKDGTSLMINVGSLILSASRMKVWMVYPSTSQDCLFDFISRALDTLGGVPEEILIDNAKTMMDDARTEYKKGKINNKFKQLADDYGFEIKPCIRARAKTKAKVENPMRVIDEIMNYNGQLNNLSEIYDKMKIINEEANSRICQATGVPPILVYQKEKEHLLNLPSEKVCSYYKLVDQKLKVGTDGLFGYKQNKYSVSPDLIGKHIDVQVIESNLYVYYNRNLITIHAIKEKKVNYHQHHHKQLIETTFPGLDAEEIKEYSLKHLEELEVYNEQLSTASRQSK